MKLKRVQIILMLAVLLVTASDLLAQQRKGPRNADKGRAADAEDFFKGDKQQGRPQPGDMALLGGDENRPANSESTGSGRLEANIASWPEWINLGRVVTFTADARGGVPPYTYQWTFVNETTGAGRASRPFSRSYIRVSGFTKPGRIKVTLYVVDSQKQMVTQSVFYRCPVKPRGAKLACSSLLAEPQ